MNIKPIYTVILLTCLLLGCGNSATDLPEEKGLSIRPATAEQVLGAIQKEKGHVVLVNVWATWCQPCVEEFPDILALLQTYKDRGLKIIFVSADFEDQTETAKAFLSKQGVDFATYQKSGKDMAFINTLDEKWSGAMPATWIYNSASKKTHFWEGKKDRAYFERAILEALEE
ncbi:MAG: TlpA disulfide reductase family protein [bacterium]|nr:TlpA disulfide reductase family protein [bacterium]